MMGRRPLQRPGHSASRAMPKYGSAINSCISACHSVIAQKTCAGPLPDHVKELKPRDILSLLQLPLP